MKHLHSLRNIAAALLACAGFASCTQDELAQGSGTPLPDGKYPVVIQATGLQAVATPASTRATVDGDWEGVNTVAVEVDGMVKEYGVTVSDAGGYKSATLSSDTNPFYWTSTTEKKNITAWWPYSDTYPTDWTVKADQSDAGNFHASDLIRGELTLAFADKDNSAKNNLSFRHQTAKVSIQLIAGDGVTFDENTSVQLLNVSGVEGGNTITSYQPDIAAYSYLALLAPQTISAKAEFIQVTVGDTDFYYTPTDANPLEAGKAYAYTITVKADGIEVTEATGGEWTEGDSENVTVKEVTAIYDGTETEAKIGDYYYSDGTWSDGGLRKLYADGTMVWADPAPQPESGKTAIGIVFYAGRHPNDNSDYSVSLYTNASHQLQGNTVHGYAVALRDATGSHCMWGVDDIELGCCPKENDQYQDNCSNPDIDWNGYAWTQTIISNGAGSVYDLDGRNQAGYPAAYFAVLSYERVVSAPAGSSGWFLPSIGQMLKVYEQRNILTTATGRNNLQPEWNWYWSSSEYYGSPGRSALFVDADNGNVSYCPKSYNYGYVRPVLAF